MAGILSSHNQKILSEKSDKPDPPSCNCRKTPCPMSGRCREKSIVYKATINCNNEAKNYFGVCETEFKARYYNHVQSFRHGQKSNATELSKYVWSCRGACYEPEVESRTYGSWPRPRTQKKSEAKAKDSLSEDRTSRGQGQECSRPRPRTQAQAFSKIKVFKIFFQAISNSLAYPGLFDRGRPKLQIT